MAKTFKTSFTMKFREGDPAGIMFFGNIFGWAHDTFEQFIVDAGYQFNEWFSQKSFIIPIRHTESDYEIPFRPGVTYEAEASVQNLGRTSFTMKYVFTSSRGRHAVVKMVHVVVDMASKKPVELPTLIKERFTPYLETP